MTTYLKDPLVRIALGAAALSFLLWAVYAGLGATERPEFLAPQQPFETYFQKVNWWPFPFFFLAMVPVLYLTWGAFLSAWRDLARTEVIRTADGGAPSPETMERVIADISRTRLWVIPITILAVIVINILDTSGDVDIYFGDASGRDQIAYACEAPDFGAGWIFRAHLTEPFACDPGLAGIGARDRVEPGGGQVLMVILMLLQQGLIIALVALAFLQLLTHTLLFGFFERWIPTARREGLTLRMNILSPVREFGLERWNYALNNFYWASCPALLAVFASRLSTPPEIYRPGQEMLGWMVPALLLLPMVLTILARQSRLPDLWPRLEDAEAADGYASQKLWPLDRNWASKLGIVLAFILAALALGHEMGMLLPFT